MLMIGKTDKGLVRESNQDDFAVGNLAGGAAFAVVCDGMGGANGGNIASKTAVEIIKKAIPDGFSENFTTEDIKTLITNSVNKANEAIYKTACENSDLYGMGTTVVAAVIKDGVVTVANAGDSRAYLVGDEITQLTHDHSVVQEMVENGKITSDEAMTHPQKNIITRALGVDKSIDIDFAEKKMADGEKLLICTDGLTNLLTDAEIFKILKDTEIGKTAEILVTAANDNGGNDNITVVVVCNDILTGGEING